MWPGSQVVMSSGLKKPGLKRFPWAGLGWAGPGGGGADPSPHPFFSTAMTCLTEAPRPLCSHSVVRRNGHAETVVAAPRLQHRQLWQLLCHDSTLRSRGGVAPAS